MATNQLSIDTYQLLTGDAYALLKTLPDESVQSVVTSPPYYSLRAYGTEPQVFGGLEDCEHEWGGELPGSARGGSGPGAKEKRTGDQKSTYGRDAARGNVCQKCEAWKGELGLEPLSSCVRPGSIKKVFELRADLPAAEREFIVAELLKRGLL